MKKTVKRILLVLAGVVIGVAASQALLVSGIQAGRRCWCRGGHPAGTADAAGHRLVGWQGHAPRG